MRQPPTIIAALAIAMMLAAGGRAGAQDFTVNVPVDLSNMPSLITAVVIECAAVCLGVNLEPSSAAPLMSSDPAQFMQTSPFTVGTGKQVRAVNSDTGEFHQTVTVSFSTDADHTPNNVVGYLCWIKLRDTQGREEYPGENTQDDIFLYASGTSVSGSDQFFATSLEGPPLITHGAFNNPAIDLNGSGAPGECEIQ